jgi:hypothetical protein
VVVVLVLLAKLLKSSFSVLIRTLKHSTPTSFGVDVELNVKEVPEQVVVGGKVHNSGPWVVLTATNKC